jgi:hypothetical protein
LDKPLHVTYKVSKLAYRILVILIANRKRELKKILLETEPSRDNGAAGRIR